MSVSGEAGLWRWSGWAQIYVPDCGWTAILPPNLGLSCENIITISKNGMRNEV